MLSPVTIGILTGDPRNHLSLSLTCLSIFLIANMSKISLLMLSPRFQQGVKKTAQLGTGSSWAEKRCKGMARFLTVQIFYRKKWEKSCFFSLLSLTRWFETVFGRFKDSRTGNRDAAQGYNTDTKKKWFFTSSLHLGREANGNRAFWHGRAVKKYLSLLYYYMYAREAIVKKNLWLGTTKRTAESVLAPVRL